MKQLKIFTLTVLLFSAANVSALDLLSIRNPGTYEVPVKDASLADAAQFDLMRVRFTQDGQQIQLRYTLPLELTGARNMIKVEGQIEADGHASLNYDGKALPCSAAGSQLTCHVAFNTLTIDQAKAERILTRKFSGAELQKKLEIQREFSTDPVGIIRIKLK